MPRYPRPATFGSSAPAQRTPEHLKSYLKTEDGRLWLASLVETAVDRVHLPPYTTLAMFSTVMGLPYPFVDDIYTNGPQNADRHLNTRAPNSVYDHHPFIRTQKAARPRPPEKALRAPD